MPEHGCLRRALRSGPGCISARWVACGSPIPSLSPSALAAASPPLSGRTVFSVREHLDVGENPPNGAIVYYWLDDDASGPVTLTFRHADGALIVTFRSDDEAHPLARRPGVRRGLNRFVWDMKHPGPVRVDPPWAALKNQPLANEPEPQSGPTVVPGEYLVELSVGLETQSTVFSILKDPRLATSPDDYAKQFALLKQLYDKLSTLNGTVNRIRLVRRQLLALTELLGDDHAALVAAAKAACERLTEIESRADRYSSGSHLVTRCAIRLV